MDYEVKSIWLSLFIVKRIDNMEMLAVVEYRYIKVFEGLLGYVPV